MGMGPGLPEQFASIARMYTAGFPCQEKSLAIASIQGSLMSTDAVANMRRFLGSRGGVGRQDVLTTGEAGGPPVGDRRQEARATYKKATKQWAGQRREDGLSRISGDKAKGDRRNLNGFNCRAGIGNRRYRRDSEDHLAPKCPWRDTPKRSRSPPSLGGSQARKPSYSAMSAEAPFSLPRWMRGG